MEGGKVMEWIMDDRREGEEECEEAGGGEMRPGRRDEKCKGRMRTWTNRWRR